MMLLPPGILVCKPGIAGHNKTPQQKASMQNHATAAIPTDDATY